MWREGGRTPGPGECQPASLAAGAFTVETFRKVALAASSSVGFRDPRTGSRCPGPSGSYTPVTLTKRFPAVKALPKRNALWILLVFLGIPMLGLAVMGALPGPTPVGVWVAVGLLASAVGACLWVIAHPRWFLEIDTFREAATWVGPDGEQAIPLHEVGPLYIGRVITIMPPGSPRSDPVTYRVLTAAAPVVLAEASTREGAERKMRRLAARLGLEVANVPEKTEYLKPGEAGL